MSDDLDDRIRSALGGLRGAAIPPVPALRAASGRARGSLGLVAAAAMLLALAGTLWVFPRPQGDAGLLAKRLETLESQIHRVDHEELRDLLGRELALLRRELELARAAQSLFP
jgi:hypothetical protein